MTPSNETRGAPTCLRFSRSPTPRVTSPAQAADGLQPGRTVRVANPAQQTAVIVPRPAHQTC